MTIQVIKPGLCTTVQDIGRSGYQHLGVPVNGAMDALAHALANLLVGNKVSSNTLEVTVQGPTLLFQSPTIVAIAGADLGAQMDSVPLPPGKAVKVQPGMLLTFGRRKYGARAYIAVTGGYLLPTVLGSSSTFTRGGFGGVEGRALMAGDVLTVGSTFRTVPRVHIPRELQHNAVTMAHRSIRIIAGREWGYFTDAAKQLLVEEPYCISNESERMGYRLTGAALTLNAPLQLLSETVTFGTLQVPSNGQPIVLMADRQTTGGYPKIAHVATVDLPLLAQRLPGDEVRFSLVELSVAQKLAIQRARALQRLETVYAGS